MAESEVAGNITQEFTVNIEFLERAFEVEACLGNGRLFSIELIKGFIS